MLNLYILKYPETALATDKSELLDKIEKILGQNELVNLKCTPEEADAIILQEKISHKDYKYINILKKDPILGKHLHKTFTINIDDGATGLLKGLYTCLPKKRYDSNIHVAVPYPAFPNELVLNNAIIESSTKHLAGWRGSVTSNKIRKKLMDMFSNDADIVFQPSGSWFNHGTGEKESYVKLIKDAKFSICPKGLAPVSFRIYESMALSRCPVIIADEFIAPAGPNWSSCSIMYPEKKIKHLKVFLESNSLKYKELGENAFKDWNQFFSPEKVPYYYVEKLLNLIESGRTSTLQDEYKRMRSNKMYVRNNWTIPQRIFNKIKQKLG